MLLHHRMSSLVDYGKYVGLYPRLPQWGERRQQFLDAAQLRLVAARRRRRHLRGRQGSACGLEHRPHRGGLGGHGLGPGECGRRGGHSRRTAVPRLRPGRASTGAVESRLGKYQPPLPCLASSTKQPRRYRSMRPVLP